jgi:hypothetical protein
MKGVVTEVVMAVPTVCQTARSVLSAIAEKAAAESGWDHEGAAHGGEQHRREQRGERLEARDEQLPRRRALA